MNASLVKLARRIVPSTATLSYNPLFRIVGNSLASLPNLVYPEFRDLPPNHLRVRVGVGNQLFNNQVYHKTIATNLWFEWLANNYCSATSRIVEIGCGCGRIAQHLDAPWFAGSYLGIDVDQELIAWSQRRFATPKFRFQLSPQHSRTYSSSAKGSGHFSFGDEPQTDFVYATSLFTHLLEQETKNYIEETSRILKRGGTMYITFFSRQHVALGGRWTFQHRIGNAYVESPTMPEAAVAYDHEFLSDLTRAAGFSEVRIVPGEGQSGLVARK